MPNSSLTIAVINRGGTDPKLLDTLYNALYVADGAAVMLILDGKCKLPAVPAGVDVRFTDETPRGTSYARHHAVMAGTKHVITCDSHIVMPLGFPAAVIAHLEAFPTHALCARCEMLPDGGIYNGARLNTYVQPDPRAGSTNKLVGEFQSIAAQWRNSKKVGPIGAIMGGCYAIAREWYIEIGAPWQHGVGWGCDEETISIVTQAHGGKCWLLPQVVGHWSQCVDGPKYTPLRSDATNTWANRMRVALTAPVDDEERDKLADFLVSSSHFANAGALMAVKRMVQGMPIKAIREQNRAGGITMEDIMAGLPMTRPELIKAIVDNGEGFKGFKRAKLEVLAAHWAKVGLEVPPPVAVVEPPKPKARANYGANEEPRVCINHKCRSSASRVIKTDDKGIKIIRRRKCLDCGRSWISFESPPITR